MNIVTTANLPETPGLGIPATLAEKPVDASPLENLSLDFSVLLDTPAKSVKVEGGEIQVEHPEAFEAGKKLPISPPPGNLLPLSLPHFLPALEETQRTIDSGEADQNDTDKDTDANVAFEFTPVELPRTLPEADDATIPTPPNLQNESPVPDTSELPKIPPAVKRPALLAPSFPKTELNAPRFGRTDIELNGVRVLPERAITEMIEKNADNMHVTRVLDVPQPAIAKIDHSTSPQSQPIPTSQFSTTPPLGQQIESLIDNLVRARESSRAVRGEMTLRHPDFGAVAVGLERAESELRAVLSNRDPGFTSAAQHALAERAVAAAADTQSTNARGQDGMPGQPNASRDPSGATQSDQRGHNQQTANKQQDLPTQMRGLGAQADFAETRSPSTVDHYDGVLA